MENTSFNDDDHDALLSVMSSESWDPELFAGIREDDDLLPDMLEVSSHSFDDEFDDDFADEFEEDSRRSRHPRRGKKEEKRALLGRGRVAMSLGFSAV